LRGVITCSGIIVVIALIVMIHASITGNNIRRDEVNRSLDGAMDFAFDRMGDVYADKYFTTYDAGKRQQILTDLMEEFCVVLSERVASDGNVTVKLIDSDLEGCFRLELQKNMNIHLVEEQENVTMKKRIPLIDK
jgi:hypothetical protein